jgi:polar amino acid transport system substrate-binding protein
MTLQNILYSCLCGVVVISMNSTVSAQQINLARNEKATEQAIAALLITDIYKRAGFVAKIQPLPGARANAMALAGETDGEVARIQGYATKNPTLIQVEPAYYYLTTTAFAKADSGIKIGSKEALKKYRVGIVRGIAHAEAATDGVPGVKIVNDYDQMYQMLDAGRLDVVIDAGANGPYVIKKLGLNGIKAVGELARLDLFTMLVPARKEWGPKVAATIKGMKDSGELAKLARRYEDDFLKSGVAP